MMETFKQFLKDCWYAPFWLKLTNSIWLAILVTILVGGSYWIANFYETTTIDPDSALGVFATFMIFIPVIAIFAARAAYDWLARKVLTHFGFIELKE